VNVIGRAWMIHMTVSVAHIVACPDATVEVCLPKDNEASVVVRFGHARRHAGEGGTSGNCEHFCMIICYIVLNANDLSPQTKRTNMVDLWPR
jgi:hypothetical protein